MKKLYLFLVLFEIISFKSQAQLSNYFANNPVWRINSSCSAPYPCVRDDQAEYRVITDTLMDGEIWHKMQRQGISTYSYFSSPPIPEGCSGTFSISEQSGFLRQDSMKIYFRTQFNPTQYLVYDFNLEVGDSLPITTINFQDFLVVNAVDSVLIGASWRRRMFFNDGASWLIEGIGHNAGLLESIPPMLECAHSFICFKLDSVIEFQENIGNCEIPNSTQEIKCPQWKLLTDISGNSWKIIGPKETDHLALIDLSGNLIPAISWSNTTCEIQLSNYSQGMYTLINLEHPSRFVRLLKLN